jgi:hypothetical protein
MSIKIAFEKETHLSRSRPQTFAELRKLAVEQYKLLPATVHYFYVDEDGDRVSVCSDEDLKILYDTVPKGKTPKITI